MGGLRQSAALALVALAATAGGALGASKGAAPAGATAQCRDGTYSFSQHHSGTCSHHGGVARWLDGSSGGTRSSSPAVTLGATVALGARTQSRGCTLAPRPDRACSPGAYYSGLTTGVLCSSGFRTSSIRNVPESEKHEVEVEYRLAPRPYGHTLEIDHIVPLELGGSNDVANIFPERAPGYHAKDRLENALKRLVCGGSLTLHAAQSGIAANWPALYRTVFGIAP
jgi:hypothetical protein